MDDSTIYRVALGENFEPETWQLALMNDAWPQILVAPTGSGKTAAVTLGWAAQRLREPKHTPRRLIWCLPMRTLVEQTAKVVKQWFNRLVTKLDNANHLPGPENVYVLMGGVDANGWLEMPEHPAVIIGTQDMLLSRALMRGYGSSRAIWPMEFALLHEDAQWVFDEVQLMGAGRATSAQLEAFRQSDADRARRAGLPVDCTTRSLWISATLNPKWLATVDHPAPPPEAVLRVDPSATPNGRLARLAQATKKLTCSDVTPESQKKADIVSYIKRLADTILEKHRPGLMTLAIVNRVDRAQELHKALNQKLLKSTLDKPSLVLIHSRFRPADRNREMGKVVESGAEHPHGRVVVATQAVEAGVDISAAVLFTEIAPWSSMVQRFGRVNRYAELPDGADVFWIDLLAQADDGVTSDKDAEALAVPYGPDELRRARAQLVKLTDVAPVNLPPPEGVAPPYRVIRRKDLDDLFDIDPDLTGFDVDVSPYVRDANDTDIRVFWRDLSETGDKPLHPRREELCAVSISTAKEWVRKCNKGNVLLYQRDPQWRRRDVLTDSVAPGWMPFRDEPWPGLILLADLRAGGYSKTVGFTGDPNNEPEPLGDQTPLSGNGVKPDGSDLQAMSETDGHDEDALSQIGTVVPLSDHLRHVGTEADSLCEALAIEANTRSAIVRAARWHDLGKAHDVFQDTMRRGLDGQDIAPGVLLAKTLEQTRHTRAYFRHELASALAFLAHEKWSRTADLTAYLIAAHHGKVRMNLRSLPRETAPASNNCTDVRFARGVWEGDKLPPFELEGDEHWMGGSLLLSVMEMGWDDVSRESWTERTQDLLAQFGPFRLAWLETLVRIADWRASVNERESSNYEG